MITKFVSKGRIIPRAVPERPQGLQVLQELTLKVGDFSSLQENEDYISNIGEFANIVAENGIAPNIPC